MEGHECNGQWNVWDILVKKWIGVLEYVWVCKRCGNEKEGVR